MFRKIFFLFIICTINVTAQESDSAIIRKIYDEALTNGKAYPWLDYMSNKIGARLSGSANAQKAVDYVAAELEKLKLDKTWKQDVMVPHWVRGEKEAAWVSYDDKKEVLNICALGGSIATPSGGIEASIIEVHDFDELAKLGREKVAGKIVFMNQVMDPRAVNPFESYGKYGKYRWQSASKAAAQGAIAVVVRSRNVSIDDYPHTGSMGYVDTIPKIPACAISTKGAERLSEILKSKPDSKFFLRQTCKTLEDAPSYNVIGEIKGSEFPDEIVLVGGHLDSWDLAQGAHDDGTGVVQSMEVLNILKALNLKPKRTIRCVAFMNEENGVKGGNKYAEVAKANNEKHLVALESDAGGFSPRGFSFEGDSIAAKNIMSRKNLFENYDLPKWIMGYGGTDIEPLAKATGTLQMGLMVDPQRYFDIHHSALDTFDRVNRRELELGAAAMTSMIWLLSEYGIK